MKDQMKAFIVAILVDESVDTEAEGYLTDMLWQGYDHAILAGPIPISLGETYTEGDFVSMIRPSIQDTWWEKTNDTD